MWREIDKISGIKLAKEVFLSSVNKRNRKSHQTGDKTLTDQVEPQRRSLLTSTQRGVLSFLLLLNSYNVISESSNPTIVNSSSTVTTVTPDDWPETDQKFHFSGRDTDAGEEPNIQSLLDIDLAGAEIVGTELLGQLTVSEDDIPLDPTDQLLLTDMLSNQSVSPEGESPEEEMPELVSTAEIYDEYQVFFPTIYFQPSTQSVEQMLLRIKNAMLAMDIDVGSVLDQRNQEPYPDNLDQPRKIAIVLEQLAKEFQILRVLLAQHGETYRNANELDGVVLDNYNRCMTYVGKYYRYVFVPENFKRNLDCPAAEASHILQEELSVYYNALQAEGLSNVWHIIFNLLLIESEEDVNPPSVEETRTFEQYIYNNADTFLNRVTIDENGKPVVMMAYFDPIFAVLLNLTYLISENEAAYHLTQERISMLLSKAMLDGLKDRRGNLQDTLLVALVLQQYSFNGQPVPNWVSENFSALADTLQFVRDSNLVLSPAAMEYALRALETEQSSFAASQDLATVTIYGVKGKYNPATEETESELLIDDTLVVTVFTDISDKFPPNTGPHYAWVKPKISRSTEGLQFELPHTISWPITAPIFPWEPPETYIHDFATGARDTYLRIDYKGKAYFFLPYPGRIPIPPEEPSQ